VWHCFD